MLATCAVQPDFAPVSSGSGFKAREYIAASRTTNPIYEVITEAHLLFGGTPTVVSLLSIGAGNPGTAFLPLAGEKPDPKRIMRSTMHDSEQRAQEIEQRIGRTGIYSRLSVEQEMQNSYVDQFDNPGWILAQTEEYLSHHETGERLDLLIQNLGVQKGPITLDQLKHTGSPNAPVHLTTAVHKSLGIPISNQDDEILAKLKPINLESELKVEPCLEGTRQDVLEELRLWAMDLDAPNILWINGYPGVGKSAISATIIEEWRSSNRLGSSFFFQRERATIMTPDTLWRMVAHDLAQRYSIIREHLVTSLNANNNIKNSSNVDAVFLQLIQKPLTASANISPRKLPIIVLDALDECGGVEGWRSEHRSGLMRTLKRWAELPRRFKLVVTSRRESDIEKLFSTTAHHLIEILSGDKVTPQSSSDIRAFLVDELRQLLVRYPSLPYDWPGEQAIAQLTDGAEGLFIWIKTVIKLLKHGEPQRNMEQVLRTGPGGMADLYTWILNASFPNPKEEEIKDFCSLLGAIMFTRLPLDITSLAHLLSIEISSIEYIYNGLKPVLDRGNILRIHHQSFADFLLDPKACPPQFFIHQERSANNLTLCCFRIMKTHLRFNICGLKSSHVRNRDVLNLTLRVDECIPPSLSYSALHWASHLAETIPDGHIYDSLQYFMNHQFLFWLEILSLLRQVNAGTEMLQSLVAWLRKSDKDDSLAVDMQRFLAAFASIISQSAPHIYISALPFAPRCLPLSKQYSKYYPQTLVVKRGGYNNWPAIQKVFVGHAGSVQSAVFSPDGRRIVSGSGDTTIRVWNTETGEMARRPLRGHGHTVNSVSFSPDGKKIASGSSDHAVHVWDADTGKIVGSPLRGHSDKVWSVSFSPDGRHIFSGSSDHTVRIWDIETGNLRTGPLRGHSDTVYSVSCSPDGKRIASASSDSTIMLWDPVTGEMVAGPLRGHSGRIYSVCFSPDGKRIASGSSDTTIRVWEAEKGEMVAGPLRGHSNTIYSVSFSPDGKRVVSGSNDETIRIWDTETAETVLGPLRGHSNTVNSVSFSPDGRKIVSGSKDHKIRVWDAETGEAAAGQLRGHSSTVYSVSFSPNGKRIVSGSSDHTICIWDVETGETVVGPLRGHSNIVHSVSFSPDSGQVVSGSRDRTIRVWDAETGRTVIGPLHGHRDTVNSVSFSPDGGQIASGSSDYTIQLRDAKTGKTVLGRLRGHRDKVYTVSFSRDGRRIVSGSADRKIRIWDAETGEIILSALQGHSGVVWSVSFSPDGRRVVSSSSDHTIRVWDVETSEMLVGPLRVHDVTFYSASFSPDGQRIIAGSSDHMIRIWDVESGETAMGPVRGHSDVVWSVSFSPDGKRIVSGSSDRTICVRDSQLNDSLTGIDSVSSESIQRQNGWVLGPNAELLFWIPPEIRIQLSSLPCTLVIDKRQVWTILDLTHFVHGQEWSRCKDQPITRMLEDPS